MRDVVRPGWTRPHRPVDPARSRVRGMQVGRHREQRQVMVASVQRAQRDASVTAKQLEHGAPAVTVEMGAHSVQDGSRRRTGGCVAESIASVRSPILPMVISVPSRMSRWS